MFISPCQAISQSFAKKKDLPMLEHCTIPRTGALDVIMSVLGPTGTSPAYSHITKVDLKQYLTVPLRIFFMLTCTVTENRTGRFIGLPMLILRFVY
jgi:hypothetical protein